MSKIIKRYVLSVVAAEDHGDIFDYTSTEFGEKQAVKYLEGLEHTFLILINQPEAWKKKR